MNVLYDIIIARDVIRAVVLIKHLQKVIIYTLIAFCGFWFLCFSLSSTVNSFSDASESNCFNSFICSTAAASLILRFLSRAMKTKALSFSAKISLSWEFSARQFLQLSLQHWLYSGPVEVYHASSESLS